MNSDDYSDWAIDQFISRFRKKLKQIGVSSGILKTVKGKGYSLRNVRLVN